MLQPGPMGCRQENTHATLTPRQTAEPTSKAEASGWSRLPRSSKPSCSVPDTASSTRLGGDGDGGGGGSGKDKAESAAAAAAEGGGIGACARSAATTSEERAAQPTMAPCATTISSVACLQLSPGRACHRTARSRGATASSGKALSCSRTVSAVLVCVSGGGQPRIKFEVLATAGVLNYYCFFFFF